MECVFISLTDRFYYLSCCAKNATDYNFNIPLRKRGHPNSHTTSIRASTSSASSAGRIMISREIPHENCSTRPRLIYDLNAKRTGNTYRSGHPPTKKLPR